MKKRLLVISGVGFLIGSFFFSIYCFFGISDSLLAMLGPVYFPAAWVALKLGGTTFWLPVLAIVLDFQWVLVSLAIYYLFLGGRRLFKCSRGRTGSFLDN
jgi:hypothetical protein